jgi:hypothetical protein
MARKGNPISVRLDPTFPRSNSSLLLCSVFLLTGIALLISSLVGIPPLTIGSGMGDLNPSSLFTRIMGFGITMGSSRALAGFLVMIGCPSSINFLIISLFRAILQGNCDFLSLSCWMNSPEGSDVSNWRQYLDLSEESATATPEASTSQNPGGLTEGGEQARAQEAEASSLPGGGEPDRNAGTSGSPAGNPDGASSPASSFFEGVSGEIQPTPAPGGEVGQPALPFNPYDYPEVDQEEVFAAPPAPVQPAGPSDQLTGGGILEVAPAGVPSISFLQERIKKVLRSCQRKKPQDKILKKINEDLHLEAASAEKRVKINEVLDRMEKTNWRYLYDNDKPKEIPHIDLIVQICDWERDL